MDETSKKLANDHWNYIKSLLEIHEESEEVITKSGFHYQTAFIHGFKHGVEWIKEQKEKQNSEATKRSFP